MLDTEIARQEIHNWVNNYLDRPSDFYGGNKPCPFAKPAIEQGEVKIVVGNVSMIRDVVSTWDDEYRVVIICVPESESDPVEDYCDGQNDFFRECESDLILIPFLPSEDDPDDPELDPEDWGALTDEAYTPVFVQRVHEVNKYSRILESRGYYEQVSPEFWAWVQKRRELSKGVNHG